MNLNDNTSFKAFNKSNWLFKISYSSDEAEVKVNKGIKNYKKKEELEKTIT